MTITYRFKNVNIFLLDNSSLVLQSEEAITKPFFSFVTENNIRIKTLYLPSKNPMVKG